MSSKNFLSVNGSNVTIVKADDHKPPKESWIDPAIFHFVIHTVMQPIASCQFGHDAFYTLFKVHCEVEAHCRHPRSSAQSMQLEATQPHGLTATNT